MEQFLSENRINQNDTGIRDQGDNEAQVITEDRILADEQENNNQLPGEIYVEPASITAEIDSIFRNPPQNLDQQIVFELLAMSSHHLQLNDMTNTDGIQNTCNMYNFILEMAKGVRQQGALCNEMIYTLGVLKRNILQGQGVRAELVRQWAQQNIDAI